MTTEPDDKAGRPLIVAGLMSGTSIDAIDAAVVEVKGSGATLAVNMVAFHSTQVPTSLRARILRACLPDGGSTRLICELNAEIGAAFAEAALAAIAAAKLTTADVDAIGSHGQTVWHQGRMEQGVIASTLQLGDPSIIAEATGITTVADFRPRDMAAGGQGAPLVSYLDWALYRSPTSGRALQNIGGIANVTVLPSNCQPAQVFAFDTGPGNMLIDAATSLASGGLLTFDRDGGLARKGTADPVLIAQILNHPFFDLAPPRTAGREQFGLAYMQGVWRDAMSRRLTGTDVVATVTQVTARSIADAYRRWILPRVRIEAMYLSGGGAGNPALLTALREELPEVPQRLLSDLGGDMQAKEATAFAVLAAETLRNVPTSFPGATGAHHAAVLGKIVPGANWGRLQRLLVARGEVHDPAVQRSVAPGDPAGPPARGVHRSRPGSARDSAQWLPRSVPPGQVTIGIDGGGTQTTAVALDGGGTVIAHAKAGPSNTKAVGWPAATDALRTILEHLADNLSPETAIVGIHAALAGAGRPEDARPVEEYLVGRCRVAPLQLRCRQLPDGGVRVGNDARAVLAAAAASSGIVAIAGTGSLIWGCTASGDTARAGGWGYLLGDEGSGFDLGRRALMAVLVQQDKREPLTDLSVMLLRKLGLSEPPDLVSAIYDHPNARFVIAGLAMVVLQQMAIGDAAATMLVQESAGYLAQRIRLVGRHLQFDVGAPCTVVCSGGLFQSDAFFATLDQTLRDRPEFTCVRPDRSPAEGAALLAWQARAFAERSPEGS